MAVMCAVVGISCVTRAQPPSTAPTTAEVERAIAADPAHLTATNDEGLTVLHIAARRGDAALVKRILELGGDPNIGGLRPSQGITPLHCAMIGAYSDAVVRSVAPPDAKDWSVDQARQQERRTRGRFNPTRGPMQFDEVTQLLLSRGADVNAKGFGEVTPLHIAAQSMNSRLVAALIEAGADVNAIHRPVAQGPMTALAYAARGGEVDVVRALVDAGADPKKVPPGAAMSNIDVFRLLLDRGMELPPDALKIATRLERAPAVIDEIMRRQKGAVRDGNLDTALYAAANASTDQRSDANDARLLETVQKLLDAGASPSAPAGSGEALIAAIVRDRPAIAKLLKDRGAKVDWSKLTENEHRPPFLAYAAALEHKLDRLREFESLGMPLDAIGAALLGRAARLRDLITSGQSQVAGEAGATALYFASSNGHVECVQVLLDAKTDPNARMPSWDTPAIGPRPLEGAALGGHIEVVRLLLNRGADPKLIELDDDERRALAPAIIKLLEATR
jgi:ankyrin repeat protein